MGDKGCFFPLIELSSLWKNTEMYYEAITTLEVYKVRTMDYYHEKEHSPRFEEAVSEQYALQVWDMAEHSKNVALLSPQKVVAARLKFLAYRFGLSINKDKVVILAPFNHQDLADALSLESSVVSQEIDSMLDMGAVELHGRHLTVHKLALEALQ